MQLADTVAALAVEDQQIQDDLLALETNAQNAQAEINQQGQAISDLQAQVAALVAAGDGASQQQLDALSTLLTDLGSSHQRLAETNALLAAAIPPPAPAPVVPVPTDGSTPGAPVGGTTGPVNPTPGDGTVTEPTDPKAGFVLKLANETYNEYVDRAAAAGFTSVLSLEDWTATEVGATFVPPVAEAPTPETVPTAESGA